MGSYDRNLFVDRDRELRGFCKLLKPETLQAVMLIKAEKWMGKSWLICRMGEKCRKDDGEPPGKDDGQTPVVQIDFKNEREMHEVQDTLSLVRLLRNKLDHPRYFNRLNDVINRFTKLEMDARVSALHSLAERMQDHYNLNQLHRLSRFLNVDPEDLPGTTKYEKAYELAAQLEHRGALGQLIEKLEEERDHVDWRQGLESLLGEPKSVPDAEGDEGEALIADNNTPLRTDSYRDRSLAERRINEAFFSCFQDLLVDVQPIVFLFDGCEEAPDEAKGWIRGQLLDRLRTGELKDVVVIFAGRTLPDVSDLDIDNLIARTELDAFDEERVRQFFEVHKVQVDPDDLSAHTRSSGGKPGILAFMVDNLTAQQDRKFFDE